MLLARDGPRTGPDTVLTGRAASTLALGRLLTPSRGPSVLRIRAPYPSVRVQSEEVAGGPRRVLLTGRAGGHKPRACKAKLP